MLFRIRQFTVVSAHFLLAYLLFRLARGTLPWGQPLSCVLINAFWLVVVAFTAPRLFRLYFDFPTKLRTQVSIALGVVLSLAAIWLSGLAADFSYINEPWHMLRLRPDFDHNMLGLSLAELTGWLVLLGLYWLNKRNFVKTIWGWVHYDWWLSPPLEAIPDLAATVSSGTLGPDGKNPAGHLEVPFTENSTRYFFSSWMDRGTTIFEGQGLIDRKLGHDEHLIIAEPRVKPTAKQIADAPIEARKLKAENERWTEETTAKRAAFVSRLKLPKKAKAWLTEKTKPTGYYWLGLLKGNVKSNRNTCAGNGTKLWNRLRIKHDPLGKGLLSLGTGWFTPINPAKILVDRNFRVLTISVDKARWDARNQSASAQAQVA